MRMRFLSENATKMYVRKVQGGVSIMLVTCSTCSLQLKEDGSPQRWQDRSGVSCSGEAPRGRLKDTWEHQLHGEIFSRFFGVYASRHLRAPGG